MRNMKILAQAIPGNTISGFQRAAEAAGHTWRWWSEQQEATFDVFDEVKPDFVFLMEETRSITKCIQEHNTIVVQGYEDTSFTFQINRKTNYYKYLVDKHMFCPGDSHPAYICDIGITASPSPVGVALCENIGKHNIKIICEKPWGVAQYIGMGSLENKRDLYRSAKLVLVDSLLEATRVAACGSVPVSVQPRGTGPKPILIFNKDVGNAHFDEYCLQADTDEEVLNYLNQKNYQRASKHNLSQCLKGHTYDDALKNILEEVK